MKNIINIFNETTPDKKDVEIETNGYLILYLVNDKIKMTGAMDIVALSPILTKIVLEKLVK